MNGNANTSVDGEDARSYSSDSQSDTCRQSISSTDSIVRNISLPRKNSEVTPDFKSSIKKWSERFSSVPGSCSTMNRKKGNFINKALSSLKIQTKG